MPSIVQTLEALDIGQLHTLASEANKFHSSQIPPVTFNGQSEQIDLTKISCSLKDLLPENVFQHLSEMQTPNKGETFTGQTPMSLLILQEKCDYLMKVLGLLFDKFPQCNAEIKKINDLLVFFRGQGAILAPSQNAIPAKILRIVTDCSEPLQQALKANCGNYRPLENPSHAISVIDMQIAQIKNIKPDDKTRPKTPLDELESTRKKLQELIAPKEEKRPASSEMLLPLKDLIAVERRKKVIEMAENKQNNYLQKLKNADLDWTKSLWDEKPLYSKYDIVKKLKETLTEEKSTPSQKLKKCDQILDEEGLMQKDEKQTETLRRSNRELLCDHRDDRGYQILLRFLGRFFSARWCQFFPKSADIADVFDSKPDTAPQPRQMKWFS